MRADFERFLRRSAHFGIEVNQIEDNQDEEEGSENEWIVLELHVMELIRVSSQQLNWVYEESYSWAHSGYL